MPLHIRPYAHPTDQPAVIALWHHCQLTRPWNDPARDIARKLTTQPDLFLVGTVDDQLIATLMAGYDGHRGWINYLAVSPDHQRQGHARALMAEAERRLHTLGCPKVNLQVRSTNEHVLAFYHHLGYTPDDVVSLGKRLIPDPPHPRTDQR
jgi:ribosomal protein S18 acetylase RimI-like enzyme